MSNPWTGKLAKAITATKRTRKFWNIFCAIIVFIILFGLSSFIYQVCSDYMRYDIEEIYVEYRDKILITNSSSFEIAEYNDQEVKITKLHEVVKKGEKIVLSISKISKELMEVKYQNQTVYKKNTASVVGGVVLLLPIVAVIAFFWIAINVKNPKSKLINQLQKELMLRFYK